MFILRSFKIGLSRFTLTRSGTRQVPSVKNEILADVPISSELQLVTHFVEQAARLSRRVQENLDVHRMEKDDKSPVTVADLAVQVLLTLRLVEWQPDVALVCEEEASSFSSSTRMGESVVDVLRTELPSVSGGLALEMLNRSRQSGAPSFWTIDPIDGTKGFLRGSNYAIALAQLEEGEVTRGVLGCPRLKLSQFETEGVILCAERGRGAWAKPLDGEAGWQRLRCSSLEDVTQARLLRSAETAHTNCDEIDRVAQDLGIIAESVGIDSQAKYAMLAAGEAEALMRIPNPSKPDYREKIWDHAAGFLVLAEAGGETTDINGLSLDFSCGSQLLKNTGVLATNGLLHGQFLGSLQRLRSLP